MKDTALRQLARWASGLRLEEVPQHVREQAINQVLSTLAAVYSGWDSDLGRPLEMAFLPLAQGTARILPTGISAPTAHAAMLMASWSMVLDFDDVMLGGHTGHSSVLVPLAIGSEGGRNGSDLLLAQIVANEVAARVNMVCAVGSTRGQMATHLHLLAAAAARAKLEEMDEDSFTEALGFALSYPSQALFPAFLGSDAKALCAGLPVRVGMEAVDAVRAGLTAAADPLDDPRGFFATAARVPVREFLGGLGEQWHTETNSFKIYPVCGYLCSALDATLDLVLSHDILPDEVEAVDVWASLFTVGMDAHSAPYLDGSRSRISTLTFSTPFTVASAIIARQFSPAQLKRSWIEDPLVWELATRVRSRHDVDLTIKALTADIPIGAALRRTRRWQAAAFGWSIAATAFGRWGRLRRIATFRMIAGLAAAAGESRPLDFGNSTKPLGARVEIRLSDGRRLSRSVSIPRGFAGALPSEAGGRSVRELMREKFVCAASGALGAQRAEEAADLIENLESLSPVGFARLVDLACIAVPDAITVG
ncbi:MAG TPA: MmgE/PrpD family protein [Pyrinomonadaceae bacterium]|jgi:2-methylcitrate dehydratase PrpD